MLSDDLAEQFHGFRSCGDLVVQRDGVRGDFWHGDDKSCFGRGSERPYAAASAWEAFATVLPFREDRRCVEQAIRTKSPCSFPGSLRGRAVAGFPAIEPVGDIRPRRMVSSGGELSVSEEAELLRAVAHQHVLGLLIMVEHHLVRLATDTRLLVATEGSMAG